jgi:hypothetical protein
MDVKPEYYANASRGAYDCPSRVSEFKMISFVLFYRTYIRISYRKPSFGYLIWFFSKFLGGMQLSGPYGRAATAAIHWLSTASSRLKRTGRGTQHSTSLNLVPRFRMHGAVFHAPICIDDVQLH